MDLTEVKDYYAQALAKHGPGALGMDWKDTEAQYVRFHALARLLNENGSVNDWGCGSGRFAKFCTDYTGYDIVPQDFRAGRFILSDKPTMMADYTVASGLFNVKLAEPWYRWNEYMLSCLKVMNQMSRKGFAFNCLSSYCDRREDKLFYADPTWVFEECRKYSPRVALLHDYSPWDFTILVRK